MLERLSWQEVNAAESQLFHMQNILGFITEMNLITKLPKNGHVIPLEMIGQVKFAFVLQNINLKVHI